MSIWDFFRKPVEKEKESEPELKTFVPATEDDAIITPSGLFVHPMVGRGVDNESAMIESWRELATRPEIDWAIQEIVNDAIVTDYNDYPVTLSVPNDSKIPEKIKKIILEEFNEILRLLNFNRNGSILFRNWYIDGKQYIHCVLDEKNIEKGIQKAIVVDTLHIKKVVETTKKRDPASGVEYDVVTDTYYVYSNPKNNALVKVNPQHIAYANSGLFIENSQKNGTISVSYLNKSLRVANQLKMMENAAVIYRIARAPERRVFYVHTGNLPKSKGDQYITSIMNKFKNKIVYDEKTGEVKYNGSTTPVLEDYWLPRRDDGRGTEVTTLPGGQNLGELNEIEYFQKKLFLSLNVPLTRLNSDSAFNLGRGAEITREELKFSKFIDMLRSRYSEILIQMLGIQLNAKNIMKRSDFETLKPMLTLNWKSDSYWDEMSEAEIIQSRLNLLRDIENYQGKYFSKKWIVKNILRFSDEEYAEIEKEISQEPDEPRDEF